jgi:hypothetical protein
MLRYCLWYVYFGCRILQGVSYDVAVKYPTSMQTRQLLY